MIKIHSKKRKKGVILLILLIATILSPLDFYIVNLALTSIQRGLNTTTGQLQMIVSFYTCAYAVFQITGGRLGDLFGRKKMFMLGLFGFIIASMICGLATNPVIMITGRIIQGISGAVMGPQILAIIHISFSEKEKPRVMALYSFTFGLAAVLGQYIGGWLIFHDIGGLGWRIIFLMNVPIGLMALIGAVFMLPDESKRLKKDIDVLGIILLSLTLGLIVYPLTLLSGEGWNISVIAMLLSSIVLLISFISYEKKITAKGKTPLVSMSVFRNRNLSIGSIVAFLFYCSGIFYLGLGIYLQEDQHWNALDAGVAIIPFGIGFVLSSLASPYAIKKIGNYTLNAGLLSYALGLICIIYGISLPEPTSYLFYSGLFLSGCGMGLTLSSIVRISLSGIPIEFAGLASGVINCSLQIGSAIGVAGIGSLFFALSKERGYSYSFQFSLSVVVALLIAACFLSLLITKKK